MKGPCMNLSRSFIVLAIVGHSYVAMGSSGPAAKVLQDAQDRDKALG